MLESSDSMPQVLEFKLIDTAVSIRPTRNRLLAATGVSACIVALSLVSAGLLVDLAATVSRNIGNSGVLIVRIKEHDGELVPDSTADNDVDIFPLQQSPITPAEVAVTELAAAPEDILEPPVEKQLNTDWYSIGEQVAKTSVDDYFRQQESRAALWRRSPSMMFDPGEKLAVEAKEPIIANLQFVPEIHVLGLGITIGSCFFGVPFAGVPVEQRSAAITLFVCADGS